MNCKTFVISLKSSIERRAAIHKQFNALGLSFTFFDGVIGKDLNLYDNPDIDANAVKQHPDWLSPGMMGCTLSHIELYRKCIKDELDGILIFEDDALPSADFNHFYYEFLKKIDPSKESVFLFYFQAWGEMSLTKSSGELITANYIAYDIRDKYDVGSTAAYFITRSACKKLLSVILPAHKAPDCWQYFFKQNGLSELNVIYPMPVATNNFRSTISSLDHFKDNNIIGKVVRLIEEQNVPILNKLLQVRRSLLKSRFHKITIINK